ncbi:MAG: glycine cleavage system protein GcvH [Candidatus Micrarchaeota archaeon]
MKFTKEHEWVRLEGDVATVGITNYAQSHLGDIVSLDLPKVGTNVKQSAEVAMIDSMKASSPVYSPVSGEVVAINGEITSSPQLVNESPEEKGWMLKIKVSNKKELDALMDEGQYKKFCEEKK